MNKVFIDPQVLLEGAFELGLRVYESGYRPTFIVGVWRGGAPVAIAVQEILEKLGCRAEHAPLQTSSYHGGQMQAGNVEVSGQAALVGRLSPSDELLIVDDIFDTGRSVEAILSSLAETCKGNLPRSVKVATLYYKPARNETTRVPDYYTRETDDWIVFPHELLECSEDELANTGALPQRFFKYLNQNNKR